MVFEVTLGNVITIVALMVAALWALFKLVSMQQEKRLIDRFDALTKALEKVNTSQQSNADATAKLEREFRQHQVDLAREYVRREDFLRSIGSLETRIDNFALRVERALNQLMGGRQ
ncbi:hypothetical protein [Paracidovorax anthurii]|uniref:Uncharacterized protein n=1 Tax=Paracidovorax anthurii TaxID=78229 RepID=A0A328ZJL8_9BURK|nr:hypothetical protein [Paracidovorax anthurii]RAR86089.1 hypothetical protein AX018_100250 [Paracidovorax anthurii]